MKIKRGIIFTIFALAGLLILANPMFAAPAVPGESGDPLITRHVLNTEIARLTEEIATLRGIVAGLTGGTLPTAPAPTPTPTAPTVPTAPNIPATERSALFEEVMLYFDAMYGEMLRRAMYDAHPPGWQPMMVPFDILNPSAGQVIIFEANAEFILRGGSAIVIAGVDGIPNVTAGRDVGNGEAVYTNNLFMVPRSDGRGVVFHTDSWIMVRGDFNLQ